MTTTAATGPEESPFRAALQTGEIALVVGNDRVTVFHAIGDEQKPMQLLGHAIVEAAIRCAHEPGFAHECIAVGAKRRKEAH